MPSADPALVARLRAGGCVFAEEEAQLLTSAAGGPDELEALVARRIAGEPLEPLIGWAEFCGLRIHVSAGVFVPRRRTQFLALRALELTADGATVLDLCCGAGAIGAVIATRAPGAIVYAADVDPAAVACARRNLPAGRVFEGDLFAALPQTLRGRIDVLAVNAPYVPTGAIPLMPPEARLYEPAVALDGGDDGLAVHRRVAASVRDWLAPDGVLLIETSDEQAERTAAIFEAAGLVAVVESSDDRSDVVELAELGGTIVVARAPNRP